MEFVDPFSQNALIEEEENDAFVKYKLFFCTSAPIDKEISEKILQELNNFCNNSAAPKNYIWNNEKIQFSQHKNFKIQHQLLQFCTEFSGITTFCENIEDEWLIVEIFKQITASFAQTKGNNHVIPLQQFNNSISINSSLNIPETIQIGDVLASFEDDDGQFLLIEAGYVISEEFTPENSKNRVFMKDGQFYLIPPKTIHSSGLKRADAISKVIQQPFQLQATARFQKTIDKRLQMNKKLNEESVVSFPVVLPKIIARFVASNNQENLPKIIRSAINSKKIEESSHNLRNLEERFFPEASDLSEPSQKNSSELVSIMIDFSRGLYSLCNKIFAEKLSKTAFFSEWKRISRRKKNNFNALYFSKMQRLGGSILFGFVNLFNKEEEFSEIEKKLQENAEILFNSKLLPDNDEESLKFFVTDDQKSKIFKCFSEDWVKKEEEEVNSFMNLVSDQEKISKEDEDLYLRQGKLIVDSLEKFLAQESDFEGIEHAPFLSEPTNDEENEDEDYEDVDNEGASKEGEKPEDRKTKKLKMEEIREIQEFLEKSSKENKRNKKEKPIEAKKDEENGEEEEEEDDDEGEEDEYEDEEEEEEDEGVNEQVGEFDEETLKYMKEMDEELGYLDPSHSTGDNDSEIVVNLMKSMERSGPSQQFMNLFIPGNLKK